NAIEPQTGTTLTVGASGDTISLPTNVVLKTDTIQNTNSSTLITQTNSTTITLGASGQTVVLASGASQSGFGRAGTVNWSSTVQTSGFTAVSGNGYFCNTTAGAFTVTLPATPTSGDIVAFKDYAQTWNTNNLTIGRNGSNIEGVANNYTASTQGLSVTLVYVDSTKGWLVVNSGDDSNIAPQALFTTATGGTVLTCGNYKTHVFTSSGCFVVSQIGNSPTNPAGGPSAVEYLVVAGGGGSSNGAGGAGGYRTTYPSPTGSLPITATTYPITVGGGGGGGTRGSSSVFSTITSTGGGAGGFYAGDNSPTNPGGSGGGGSSLTPAGVTGGSGNTPPVSPPQGNPGGNGGPGPQITTGGGGGAGASGGTAGPPTGAGGTGGVGAVIADAFFGPTSPSYGTPGPAPGRYFAGGGTGGTQSGPVGPNAGGAGGGGFGGRSVAGCGTASTGGGAGGSGNCANKSGGSGFVAIRYKYQ
ncbi:hypothetical protein EBU71_07575, partial [bacterium]|nr:hypothetical protein [Candidatus Elulimicrobium humile]